jgi:hypothetical protein
MIFILQMFTENELDILEQANVILDKKRKLEKENNKINLDNKKRKIYDDELKKLDKKKQKFLNKITNINEHLEEYKKVYLKKVKNEIYKVDK